MVYYVNKMVHAIVTQTTDDRSKQRQQQQQQRRDHRPTTDNNNGVRSTRRSAPSSSSSARNLLTNHRHGGRMINVRSSTTTDNHRFNQSDSALLRSSSHRNILSSSSSSRRLTRNNDKDQQEVVHQETYRRNNSAPTSSSDNNMSPTQHVGKMNDDLLLMPPPPSSPSKKKNRSTSSTTRRGRSSSAHNIVKTRRTQVDPPITLNETTLDNYKTTYQIGDTLINPTQHSLRFTCINQATKLLSNLQINSPLFVKRTDKSWTFGILIDKIYSPPSSTNNNEKEEEEHKEKKLIGIMVDLTCHDKGNKKKKKVVESSKWLKCVMMVNTKTVQVDTIAAAVEEEEDEEHSKCSYHHVRSSGKCHTSRSNTRVSRRRSSIDNCNIPRRSNSGSIRSLPPAAVVGTTTKKEGEVKNSPHQVQEEETASSKRVSSSDGRCDSSRSNTRVSRRCSIDNSNIPRRSSSVVGTTTNKEGEDKDSFFVSIRRCNVPPSQRQHFTSFRHSLYFKPLYSEEGKFKTKRSAADPFSSQQHRQHRRSSFHNTTSRSTTTRGNKKSVSFHDYCSGNKKNVDIQDPPSVIVDQTTLAALAAGLLRSSSSSSTTSSPTKMIDRSCTTPSPNRNDGTSRSFRTNTPPTKFNTAGDTVTTVAAENETTNSPTSVVVNLHAKTFSGKRRERMRPRTPLQQQQQHSSSFYSLQSLQPGNRGNDNKNIREERLWKSCTGLLDLNLLKQDDDDDECNKSEGSSIINCMPPTPPYGTGSTTTTYSAKEYK